MTEFRPKQSYLDSVTIDNGYINLTLTDGRILMVPVRWFPRVAYAREEDRQDFEIIGRRGVAWFQLETDLTVEQVLQGQGSDESEASFKTWQESYNRGETESAFPFLPAGIFFELE
ncbi:DUF2442 domain-containing protein [Anaerolineales bacterium HSG6]|nr:DUF2442 domain-containing protein [Anaerolineales bacterium HSG6]